MSILRRKAPRVVIGQKNQPETDRISFSSRPHQGPCNEHGFSPMSFVVAISLLIALLYFPLEMLFDEFVQTFVAPASQFPLLIADQRQPKLSERVLVIANELTNAHAGFVSETLQRLFVQPQVGHGYVLVNNNCLLALQKLVSNICRPTSFGKPVGGGQADWQPTAETKLPGVVPLHERLAGSFGSL